ncbi:MAG TPA: outer-membrane lipoprotein carrier protein LolA [Caulobacterales bacterium]|nr:outer-membrane lipoprotein carrier protein LolA [Caulobacterales bacterium]
MHRTLLLAAAFAALSLSPAAAQLRGASPTAQAPQPVMLMGPARTQALAFANRSLNAMQSLQGRFVQTSPGGQFSGAFYLQRPGKLRFEYDPPATMLIVSDGRVVSVRDRALRTTQRTPLRSTPLNFILRSDIDLDRDANITRVVRQGSALFVTARDRTGQANGEITMRLDLPEARLSSWEVIDATGARTNIALTEVSEPASLDRRLFRMDDIVEPRGH